MNAERDRYQFVLREPLIELCQVVAERYVRPILNRDRGWDLECDARPGKALTSICKNDYGRTGPYHSVQWVTFYRRERGSKRADAQFFVRVAADGVRYGFHLGASAKDAGRAFRANLDRHAAAVAELVPLGEFRFWTSDEFDAEVPVRSAGELRAWASNKAVAVGKSLPPDSSLLRRDELAGEVLLAFDKLVPLFACAAESEPVFVVEPLAALQPAPRSETADAAERRVGRGQATPRAAEPQTVSTTFADETLLSDSWLARVLGLLRLKKQLILQGVPGTGKTHVARHLARLLTDDDPTRVRLVQFHPAYSYEEFVEGIRAEASDGGVTYPVVAGVLCAFADVAASRPDETHVLVIDEINRGNLPRIFGELLYLLEYRDEAVTLPYSKRPFRLPPNLLVVATMNAADRSAVPLDQAVRRRFSFVEMEPDAAILASWLERHPPADDTLGPRVVRAFEELNRRLSRDAGADRRIGHSAFMVPDLDAAKLAAVWDHHVRPALLDALGGREERVREYTFANLSGDRPRKKTRV